MSGTPVPGVHWLELEFDGSVVSIKNVVIDFEDAFCDDYIIELGSSSEYKTVYEAKNDNKKRRRKEHHHVVDSFDINYISEGEKWKKIRVTFNKPATKWGISVWRLVFFGSINL